MGQEVDRHVQRFYHPAGLWGKRTPNILQKLRRVRLHPLSCFGAHSSFLFTPGCDFEFRWFRSMEKDRGCSVAMGQGSGGEGKEGYSASNAMFPNLYWITGGNQTSLGPGPAVLGPLVLGPWDPGPLGPGPEPANTLQHDLKSAQIIPIIFAYSVPSEVLDWWWRRCACFPHCFRKPYTPSQVGRERLHQPAAEAWFFLCRQPLRLGA